MYETREIGRTTVLVGERGGRYPDGNSLLLRGSEETVIVDPALGLVARQEPLPAADRVLNSHCHEDHIAGNFLFPEASWHLHEADLPGMVSLEGMLDIYGFSEPLRSGWRSALVERFHYTACAAALPYRDGDVFDLGGLRARVIHAPGHTRGHCFFHVEPDDVLYLADVDLSSFGPYYGDAWSSLEDFECTLGLARKLEARYYATFHHIGVIEGRRSFLERLDRYEAVISSRESRLLDFLSEPRSIEEIVKRRFVYRPGDESPVIDAVERRSMTQHLDRLLRDGRARELEPGLFGRTPVGRPSPTNRSTP